MRAFILAGGFATRLWPLTEKRAKPLLPLAGKPLISHLVEKIPEGIEVTVSTNAVFAEDFENWKHEVTSQQVSKSARPADLKTCRPEDHIKILIEDAGHEDEKLGALGAVAKWITEENIDDDVLLLAGDNYVGFSIEEFIQKYSSSPLLAAHDINDTEQAKQFGTVICDGRSVTGFEEKPQNPQSTLISTGIYVIPKKYLSELVSYAKEKPDNIGGIFEHFLSKNISVECASFNEPWFDVGSFEAYLEATKVLVGDQVLMGEGSEQQECEMSGSVVMGKSCRVARCTLQDVVLFDDCMIEDCNLERCIIDNSCRLEGIDLSGKMLRERTELLR